MRRTITGLVMAGALALAGTGCGDSSTGPGLTVPPPEATQRLIDDTALPRAQAPRWLGYGEQGAVVLFWVEYGRANDCPSGCFYSRAWGFQVGGVAAWARFYDTEQVDVPGLTTFQFTEANRDAFTATVLAGIERDQPWFYRNGLLVAAAESPAAGPALLGLVANSLFTYIDPHLAHLLIENPAVRADRELLFTLAGLPHFQGDAYAEVRAEARRLLGVSLAG